MMIRLSIASMICYLLSLVLSMLCIVNGIDDNINCECDFFSAPSTLPIKGRGIFSAKALIKSDLIEESPTLTFSSDYWHTWSLGNFVYASNDKDRALVAFGIGMMYNNLPPEEKNVYDVWSSDEVYSGSEKRSDFTTSTTSYFYANDDIEAGDELFISYGANWFSSRSIQEFNTSSTKAVYRHDIEYLKAHGICMTHIYVSQSKLPMAGKGIFAKKAFQEGEVIYVSPVLLLPKHEVIEASNDSVLLNYCIAPLSEIDIAILPIGLSAMANHQGRQLANMAYRWTAESLKALEQDPKLLLKLPYAPLDLEYYALRDIAAEEELTLDYGEEWINAWATYLGTKSSLPLTTLLYHQHDIKFRHPIAPAPAMIPESWNGCTCVGKSCCKVDKEINVTTSHTEL